MFLIIRPLKLAAVLTFIVAWVAAGIVQGQQYNFNKDILSVLQQKCFSCHAGENREGDLWLDSKESILQGGHTGSELLGDSSQSELIARIESTEVGYRMPKESPPLSAAQQKAFRSWIDDGAPWPQSQTQGTRPAKTLATDKNPSPEKSGNFVERAGDFWLDAAKAYQQPSWKYASWILLPTAIVAFFVWLNGVLYRRRQRRKGEPVERNLWGRAKTSILTLAIVALAACCAFLWGRVEENQATIAQLEKSGPPKKQKPQLGVSFSAPPEVARPMHPKRLGGAYYRGNDERSEQLFNNGFYRTADMNVQLVDGQGNPVNYDSQVDPESLGIEFRFSRATSATTKLFLKRLLETSFISSSWGGIEKSTDKVFFSQNGSQDQWSVTFPLKLNGNAPNHRGELFVYYGSKDRTRIHYKIAYDLRMGPDGSLDANSEVWMGSAYHLGGRVISPQGNQILIDRWFDFRPIPEIVGENSDSAELLGLPEHLKQ